MSPAHPPVGEPTRYGIRDAIEDARSKEHQANDGGVEKDFAFDRACVCELEVPGKEETHEDHQAQLAGKERHALE